MPDFNFHGLRDDIVRTVQQPEFASVTRRARRIRNRRRTSVAGATGALVAALSFAVPAFAPGGIPTAPVGSVTVGPSPNDTPSDALTTMDPPVRWAEAGDRDNLYALLDDCPTCQQRLMGSDDAGRTWRLRHTFRPKEVSGPRIDVGPDGSSATMHALGAKLLLLEHRVADTPASTAPRTSAPAEPVRPPTTHRLWQLSTDGGVTWHSLTVSDTPVAAAPAGTPVLGCDEVGTDSSSGRCPVYAVDPQAARIGPLTVQPPLDEIVINRAPAGAGLWAEGYDPATRRPAVAVSRDGGRSWARSAFTDEPAVPSTASRADTEYRPKIATTDGRTVYTVFDSSARTPVVYRSTDGGSTWARVVPDESLTSLSLLGQSWVTADGALVVLAFEQPDHPARLLISQDGRHYTPVKPPGATDNAVDELEIMRAPQLATGRYVLHTSDTIYLSDDGRRWRTVTP